MKVRCINNRGWQWNKPVYKRFLGFIVGKKDNTSTGPKKGDIVTVISEHWREGELWYVLMEWPKGNGVGFNSKGFVPLEEKFDEITFEQLKKEKPISVN